MKNTLIKEYNNIINLNLPYKEPKNSFNIHFVNCASCEILGPEDNDYHVVFKDNKTGKKIRISDHSVREPCRACCTDCVEPARDAQLTRHAIALRAQ